MALITFNRPITYGIDYVEITAKPVAFENAYINGKQDDEVGTLSPIVKNEIISFTIFIDKGIISNWPKGTTAEFNYKVVDKFNATFYDYSNNYVVLYADYPFSGISERSFDMGDYISIEVDENGKIKDWHFDTEFFEEYFNCE